VKSDRAGQRPSRKQGPFKTQQIASGDRMLPETGDGYGLALRQGDNYMALGAGFPWLGVRLAPLVKRASKPIMARSEPTPRSKERALLKMEPRRLDRGESSSVSLRISVEANFSASLPRSP
jgi:hypothetical protein